ncbi:hypothetical protein GLOIN_2v1776328 [Rhizophagus irregularis DAOM 181602=DAOM 197198]|nr:hypothetical protein GLOIN_2v1776328 [Rhizophagus irregularis DAOM 181602=DAOM 197198]
MSCLVTAKVEKLLLEGPLDAICSATVIYQTMNRNDLLPYEEVIKIVESAVKSSLERIRDFQRKESVMEVLTEMKSGYKSILGLNKIKVLDTNKESTPDTTEEEIKKNIEMLNEKLKHPLGDDDGPLYSALKKTVENIEPCNKMKCTPPKLVVKKCEDFLENFEVLSTHKIVENAKHDNKWKEDDSDLLKITGRILDVLGEIWSSPIYATSTSRNKQSEGTYITDVIVPLLRASLANLPNGYICTSIAERQSIASKIRKNKGIDGERIDDDDVKLWREMIDGTSAINALCKPAGNEFGVVGIQIAGLDMNIMIVNKSLITQALLENPPRNTSQSTTVSTPDNSIIKYTKPSCPDVKCLIDVESTLVRCHLDSHNVCVMSNRHLFDVISMFT